jgi:hypothetical protein
VSAIRSEIVRIAAELRERETGLSVEDADMLDGLEAWLREQPAALAEGETKRRDYRSDGTGPIPKGRKLPGVTGVIGGTLGWSKEALSRWAAREAASACADYLLDGAAPSDAIFRAKFDPFTKRDTAGDAGTLAHALIETYARGLEVEDDPFVPAATMKAARSALDRFKRWWDVGHYDLVHAEHPLVDQRAGYGGTIDLVFRRKSDGAIILGDLKTGKRVYDEQIVQLGAYTMLLHEVAKLTASEAILLHIPLINADTGEPDEKTCNVVPVSLAMLELGAAAFLSLLFVYRNRKALTLFKEAA